MQDFEKKRNLKFQVRGDPEENTTFGTDSAKVQETLAQKFGYTWRPNCLSRRTPAWTPRWAA